MSKTNRPNADRAVIDQLVAELARLKSRVEALEHAQFAAGDEYVEGWTRAAKLVGVSVMTCRNRAVAGQFPKPCRTEPFARASGETFSKPTWRRADLVAYAEGR